MTRSDLMQHFAAADVTLRIEGDALRYRAPRGAMTPDLRAALVERKPDMLHDYHERAAIREFEGGLERAEAERLAAEDILNNATPERRAER